MWPISLLFVCLDYFNLPNHWSIVVGLVKSTEHSEFDSIVCMRSKIIEFSKCNIRLSPLLGLIMHALQS